MPAPLRSVLLLITLAAGCEAVIPEVKGADGGLAEVSFGGGGGGGTFDLSVDGWGS